MTVDQFVDLLEEIAGVRLTRSYRLGAPTGVRGRNSDNTLISELLDWTPSTPLRAGMERTYRWVEQEYLRSQATTG